MRERNATRIVEVDRLEKQGYIVDGMPAGHKNSMQDSWGIVPAGVAHFHSGENSR